ncbi:S41 family peptidase [Sulfidibacter corallicola]|uniref:S41 family peptidase n=1 Tax=Sulfidibacter corallicola TaxID=2818388 RepID=A0A8A4TMY9_SULCO|nr:S41 family peptidase [Sulfidibacter corallicola]QTD51336.1 S41 family peptidase [Sulfidibacter corallicola]
MTYPMHSNRTLPIYSDRSQPLYRRLAVLLVALTVLTLGRFELHAAESLYLPHFTFRQGLWETQLSLNNTQYKPQRVSVRAYDNDGNLNAESIWTLHPGEGIWGSIADLMPELTAETGWLELSSDGTGLEGLMKFTRLGGLLGSSSLPLTDTTSQALLLPLLEHSTFWESGLAVVNTADEQAVLDLELISRDGRVLDRRQRSLAAKAKLVSMLDDIFTEQSLPDSVQVRITSDKTITGFALTFGPDITQIVSVPASVIAGAPEETVTLDEIKGLWRRIGYGQYLQVDEERVSLFEANPGACLFDSDEFPVAALSELITVKRRHDGTLAIHTDQDTIPMLFEPTAELPATCAYAETPDSDPVLNFETAWRIFKDHYAYFALDGVDWDAVYQELRPRAEAVQNDEELFALLSDLIRPLDNGHVGLHYSNRAFFPATFKGSMQRLFEQFQAQSEIADFDTYQFQFRNQHLQALQETYLTTPLKQGGNNRILWARIGENVGYLNFLAFSGFGPEEDEPGYEQLVATLEEVLNDFEGVDKIVLDVRFNPGGTDTVSSLVASYFARTETVAFSERPVTDTGLGPFQSVWITPREGRRFEGDVALLTAPFTGSAAEVFSLYMRTQPHVTLIGEPTFGAFSDSLDKRLPNGWVVTLSNEEYVAIEGVNYEGQGVPVEVPVENFTAADQQNGTDAALAEALAR